MRYHVERFVPWHYEEACVGQFGAWHDPRATGRLYMERGASFTLFGDDAILACAGIAQQWPGTWEAWLLPTAEACHHPIILARHLRRGLDVLLATQRGIRRLQADCVQQHEAAVRLLSWLGFQFESRMAFYGPNGEHFLRLVRFP